MGTTATSPTSTTTTTPAERCTRQMYQRPMYPSSIPSPLSGEMPRERQLHYKKLSTRPPSTTNPPPATANDPSTATAANATTTTTAATANSATDEADGEPV